MNAKRFKTVASHVVRLATGNSSPSVQHAHHYSLPTPVASTSMLSRITSPRLERIGSLNFGGSGSDSGDQRRRVMSYDGEKRLLSSTSIANLEKKGITYTTLNHKSVIINDNKPLAEKTQKYRAPHNINTFRGILEAYPAINSSIMSNLEHDIQAFCDKAIEAKDLSDMHNDMKELLQKEFQLLESIDHTLIQKIMDSTRMTSEALYQIFESYIMERTYDIVFFKITSFQQNLDANLSAALHGMANLDLTQVGLPNISGMAKRLAAGLEVFREIGSFRTPKEKLDCLLSAISKLTSSSVAKDSESITSAKSSEETLSMNSDVLIPLLIIAIIQSRVSNLIANLTYMKEYAFEHNVTTGEYGYALSTLEGVIQYLVESEQQLGTISAKNEQFWSYLRDGNYEHVKDVYDEENEEYLNQSIQSLPVIDKDGSMDETETTVQHNTPIAFHQHAIEQHATGPLVEFFDEKEASESVPMRPRTGSIRSLSSGPRSISVMQTRDAQANNALLLACMSDNAKLVEFLLERQNGCGPRDLNNMHRTPLMIAAMSGNIEVVRLLLKDKYVQETIDREDIDGNTALLLACAYAGSEASGKVVKELIDNGSARLRVSNHQGNNPLHVAAIGGRVHHKEILLLLCKMMSKDLLNGQNAEGSTVFHLCKEPDVCYKLIHDRGVHATIADKHGRTPLMSWCLKGDKNMVQFFLEEGSSRLDQIDIHGQSVLHLACSSEKLLSLPSTPEFNDEVMDNVLDIVRMLLAKTTSQLHQRDWIDGNTPLHISAMKSGGYALVKLLLDNNANLDIYNNKGQRPVYVAKDQRIIDLLDDTALFRKPIGKDFDRQCAITRAEIGRDAKVTYIIKCGTLDDRHTVATVRRSFDDFRFVRQQILFELPETFIPTLTDILNPESFNLHPPPIVFLDRATQALNAFLGCLFENHTLKIHELVWEFVMVPDLQRDVIRRRSSAKRDLLIESINDEYSSSLENLESEKQFFLFTKNAMQPLHTALARVAFCSKRIQSCYKDVAVEITHLAQELGRKQAFEFSTKWSSVAFLRGISNPSIFYEVDMVRMMDFAKVIQSSAVWAEGALIGIQRPLNLLTTIEESIDEMEKQKAALQRAVSWNDVFSTADQRKKITDTKDQVLELQFKVTKLACQ
ncbi:hypothetical protein INT43_003771, partial [Umbelopsis isabellina]